MLHPKHPPLRLAFLLPAVKEWDYLPFQEGVEVLGIGGIRIRIACADGYRPSIQAGESFCPPAVQTGHDIADYEVPLVQKAVVG